MYINTRSQENTTITYSLESFSLTFHKVKNQIIMICLSFSLSFSFDTFHNNELKQREREREREKERKKERKKETNKQRKKERESKYKLELGDIKISRVQRKKKKKKKKEKKKWQINHSSMVRII